MKLTLLIIRRGWLIALVVLTTQACSSPQRIDSGFVATLPSPPTYEAGAGPTVWIDEGHNNIVATSGRYAPFIDVLEADGYVVRGLQSDFTRDRLRDVELLVIGNALGAGNLEDWALIENGSLPSAPTPTFPAFSDSEIDAIHGWVTEGGGLLLLGDHMPFSGAAAGLAERFGFTFLNGFVEDIQTGDPVVFRRSDGTLLEHSVTRGLGRDTNIEFVTTSVGQAFQAEGADPLMLFGPHVVSYQPAIPWDYDEKSPFVAVTGWLQGAVDEVGSGRVAVFGDATMFSAQLAADGSRMGMNSDMGVHHVQLLLNVMQWLGGLESPR